MNYSFVQEHLCSQCKLLSFLVYFHIGIYIIADNIIRNGVKLPLYLNERLLYVYDKKSMRKKEQASQYGYYQ